MAARGFTIERRPTRSFTKEFNAETVELIRTTGKRLPQVCRDLALSETAVRRWVMQAEIDAGRRNAVTTAEWEEPGPAAAGESDPAGGTRDPQAAACFDEEATR